MLRMAFRSLRQNALASILTALSVALGTGLAIAVLLLASGAQGAFDKTATGVPILIAGTGGSRIDAMLATTSKLNHREKSNSLTKGDS